MNPSLRRLCLCIVSAVLPGLMAPLAAHPVLTFPMLKPVNELEHTLRAKNPEFF
jgi:hypothetical protein